MWIGRQLGLPSQYGHDRQQTNSDTKSLVCQANEHVNMIPVVVRDYDHLECFIDTEVC